MVLSFLGLGSNLGDRLRYLQRAYLALRGADGLCDLRPSPVYETAPVGLTSQPAFLNMVLELQTSHSPEELLRVALEIERRLGRRRTVRWGPRVIDIDVLWYGGREVHGPELTVPHPRLLERPFVLVPLADLAPELPVTPHRTARELAEVTPDLRMVAEPAEFLRTLPEVDQ